MVQQRISTPSVIDIRDEVILTSQDHIQGAPAVDAFAVASPTSVDVTTNTITIFGHGFVTDDRIAFVPMTAMPAPLLANTAYWVVNAATDTFQVSLTQGGAAIDLTTTGVGTIYASTGIAVFDRDPWDQVLTSLEPFALDAINIMGALNAAASPTLLNYFVTRSEMDARIDGSKIFVLVGPPGSGADYEGTDQTPFNDAITEIQARASTDGGVVVVLPATYTFTSTLTVPSGVQIEGVHPDLVTITKSAGNFNTLLLSGTNSKLSRLTIEAPTNTTTAAIRASGTRNKIYQCLVDNFGFVGVQFSGARNTLQSCRIQSSTALGQALLLQSNKNEADFCSFAGTLPNGAVKVEGSDCGVFSSTFASSMTGYAYLIQSTTVNDTRIVCNHFASPAAVAASVDSGTDSVRYGNTPNTLSTNFNNFLVPLAQFTGQPTISTTTVSIPNNFTHPLTSDNLTELIDYPTGIIDDPNVSTVSLDLAVKRMYEERNYYLHSPDPTFDGLGVPTAGVFSWDGTTLTYPQFFLRSLHRASNWTINAGSNGLTNGQVLYVDVPQTGAPGTLTPTVASIPLALVAPTDAYRHVLAVCFSGGVLLWREGFRLLTNLTSFDIDGTPLPIVRFVGSTESRNPAPAFDGFAGIAQEPLTPKLASQSQLLRQLFERTNLGFTPTSDDAELSMDPEVGAWYAVGEITPGIPTAPTHVIALRGTAYGLDPGTGLYRFERDANTWILVTGNPVAAPFTSIAKVRNGIAILSTTGSIAHYDPDNIGGSTWTTFAPQMDEATSAVLPFASSRTGSFQPGGQADFQQQTANYTFFTTLDGYAVRFSIGENKLRVVPRAFVTLPGMQGTVTGALVDPLVGEKGLLSMSLKDTGFNSQRDPDTLWESLDNDHTYTTSPAVGVQAQLLGLHSPLSLNNNFNDFKTINFENLESVAFSHDPSSGAFMAVCYYAATSTYYTFGGGKDKAYILNKISNFGTFTPQNWYPKAATQELIILGKVTATGAFAMMRGAHGANGWEFTSQTIGAANTCGTAYGVWDIYYNSATNTDFYALVSNPSRGNRPSLWKRDASGTWTFKTLIDVVALAEDVLVPAAVSGVFTGLRCHGVASPKSIAFMIRDEARTNRPTIFYLDRGSGSYGGVRIADVGGDVTKPEATANTADEILGGGYSPPYHMSYWLLRRQTTNIVVPFLLFHDGGTGYNTIGSQASGTAYTLPVGYRSKNLVSHSHLSTDLGTPSQDNLWFWSSLGLTQIAILANRFAGLTSLAFGSSNARSLPVGLPSFSAAGPSTYQVQFGSQRGGDASLQIGSRVEPTLSVQSAGNGYRNNDTGLFMHEPGTAMKVQGTCYIGLNRGGYFWIGNPSLSSRPVEFAPNTTIRNDIVVANLGTTSDFDFATSNASTVGIVFIDAGNSNRLGFILYNLTTGAVTLERSTFAPMNGLGDNPLATTAKVRIEFNSFASAFDIIAEDNAGNLVRYRRLLTGTWTFELLGFVGKNPSKPRIEANGDILLAAESSATNLRILLRTQALGTWSSITTVNNGKYLKPELTKSGTTYYAFGSSGGIISATIYNNPISWVEISNSLITSFYSRFTSNLAVFGTTGYVVATATLAASGTALANQEVGVFCIQDGQIFYPSAFSAKGRLMTSYLSGEEETTYGTLSFTPAGGLVYSAIRPGRTNRHFAIRYSRTNWTSSGDSVLASGRVNVLGTETFRENYIEITAESRGLIDQFNQDNTVRTNWTALPIASREYQKYTSLRWIHDAGVGSTSLFFKENPSIGLQPDTGLQSGAMQAAASRSWPTIVGSTRVEGGPGASVFYHGACLVLQPPPGVTSATYFGIASVGSNNFFRLKATNVVRILGSWRFNTPNDTLRTANIVGPITLTLTGAANGSHAVFDFPYSSSLIQDTVANPLTYWTNYNFQQIRYPIVLGELRDTYFFVYLATKKESNILKLALGAHEPREQALAIQNIRYYFPAQFASYKQMSQAFSVQVLDVDSVSMKIAGRQDGMQALDFPLISGSRHLLCMQGLPPRATSFYFRQVELDYGPSGDEGSNVKQIVGRYGNLVVFDT